MRKARIDLDSLPPHFLPSESTIGRIKGRFPEEQRSPYREVRWPISFQSGDLPWEATRLWIELIDMHMAGGFLIEARLLVRNVAWCWRITQARPDASIRERWEAACLMAAHEAAPDLNEHVPPRIQSWLIRQGDLEGIDLYSGGSLEWVETALGLTFSRDTRETISKIRWPRGERWPEQQDNDEVENGEAQS